MPDRREIASLLMQWDRALILTHCRPDGDAVGSALGLQELMRTNGKSADVWIADEIPVKYRTFAGNTLLQRLSREDLTRYHGVIVLDCAANERCSLGESLDFPWEEVPVLCIDHHENNSVSASWKYVDPQAAATCEVLTEIALASEWQITPRAATLLLLGLITDTGAFRFSNTSGRALRTAAALREAGADWDGLMNAIFFSKPRNQQLLEADLLQNHCRMNDDGTYIWAILKPELLEQYKFDLRDGENLIDLLREIDTGKIAALIYPKGNGVKISLRGKDPRYPVLPVAQAFGGGGHLMAAGASAPAGVSLEDTAEMLRRKVEEFLQHSAGEGR